jgi:hypothetical protein
MCSLAAANQASWNAIAPNTWLTRYQRTDVVRSLQAATGITQCSNSQASVRTSGGNGGDDGLSQAKHPNRGVVPSGTENHLDGALFAGAQLC